MLDEDGTGLQAENGESLIELEASVGLDGDSQDVEAPIGAFLLEPLVMLEAEATGLQAEREESLFELAASVGLDGDSRDLAAPIGVILRGAARGCDRVNVDASASACDVWGVDGVGCCNMERNWGGCSGGSAGGVGGTGAADAGR